MIYKETTDGNIVMSVSPISNNGGDNTKIAYWKH